MLQKRIIEDCKYFEIENFNYKMKYGKYYTNEQQIKRLTFNLNLVEKIYNYCHDFEIDELRILINQLKYLHSNKLIEALILLKFKIEYLKENNEIILSKDIFKIYDTIIIKETLFETFFSIGLIDPIITIKKNNPNIITDLNLFTRACEEEHLEIAKYYYLEKYLILESYRAFKLSCKKGKLIIVKWIYSLNFKHIDKFLLYKIGFEIACEYNQENIVMFFHDKIESLVRGFREACINNHVKIAKFIYNYETKIMNQNLLEILRVCFNRGHLEIIQFLYSIDDFSSQMAIVILNSNIFDKICNNGYSELASWIYFMFGLYIPEELVEKHFKVLNLQPRNNLKEFFIKLKNNMFKCNNIKENDEQEDLGFS